MYFSLFCVCFFLSFLILRRFLEFSVVVVAAARSVLYPIEYLFMVASMLQSSQRLFLWSSWRLTTFRAWQSRANDCASRCALSPHALHSENPLMEIPINQIDCNEHVAISIWLWSIEMVPPCRWTFFAPILDLTCDRSRKHKMQESEIVWRLHWNCRQYFSLDNPIRGTETNLFSPHFNAFSNEQLHMCCYAIKNVAHFSFVWHCF